MMGDSFHCSGLPCGAIIMDAYEGECAWLRSIRVQKDRWDQLVMVDISNQAMVVHHTNYIWYYTYGNQVAVSCWTDYL